MSTFRLSIHYGTVNVVGNIVNTNSAYIYAKGGGLIGESSNNLTDAYAIGEVDVKADNKGTGSSAYAYTYAGGLVGETVTGSISNAYTSGNVIADARTSRSSNNGRDRRHIYAGGLAGTLNESTATLTNVFAEGNLTLTSSFSDRTENINFGRLTSSNKTAVDSYYKSGQVIKRNSPDNLASVPANGATSKLTSELYPINIAGLSSWTRGKDGVWVPGYATTRPTLKKKGAE